MTITIDRQAAPWPTSADPAPAASTLRAEWAIQLPTGALWPSTEAPVLFSSRGAAEDVRPQVSAAARIVVRAVRLDLAGKAVR
jgi:hypothetical protein